MNEAPPKNDFCKCKYEDDGHGWLADTRYPPPPTGSGGPVFVHARCGLPAFLVWQKHERMCEDCGRTFSSPTEELCWACSFQEFFDRDPVSAPWQSWTYLGLTYWPKYRREVQGIT